jgi:hypothetical protein
VSDQPQAVQDYLNANPFSYHDYVKVVRVAVDSINIIAAKDQEIADLEAALDACLNP